MELGLDQNCFRPFWVVLFLFPFWFRGVIQYERYVVGFAEIMETLQDVSGYHEYNIFMVRSRSCSIDKGRVKGGLGKKSN